MSSLILSDRGDQNTHSLPTAWLVSRLVPWMVAESAGGHWWACVLTNDGKFLSATHDGGLTLPSEDRMKMGRDVCRHLNRQVNFGGAWQCAWIDQMRFYMLWRDRDGDIQIPIEVDLGFDRIRTWPLETWENHAVGAWDQWREFHANMEYSKSQLVRLAQGERVRG